MIWKLTRNQTQTKVIKSQRKQLLCFFYKGSYFQEFSCLGLLCGHKFHSYITQADISQSAVLELFSLTLAMTVLAQNQCVQRDCSQEQRMQKLGLERALFIYLRNCICYRSNMKQLFRSSHENHFRRYPFWLLLGLIV